MTAIELRNVSRWYGNVVAVNDITMTIGPGVTGLLGPNGAGKSTLLHLISGFLAPSRGELTVGGAASWHNPDIYRTIGLVPERDSVYAFLTGEEFVRTAARLHKLPDADAAARRAIAIVEMADAQDRKISTYSKGMRQRIKVAAALVHDPAIMCIMVDFPAPFGPSRPVTPGPIVIVMSLTATTLPYHRETLRSSIAVMTQRPSGTGRQGRPG